MTDRPIIFSAPMVRALLDGRKTQTRRVIAQPDLDGGERWVKYPGWWVLAVNDEDEWRARLPYAPGDRLWVREAVCWVSAWGWRYRADNDDLTEKSESGEVSRWRPSIHMPRAASRITLTVAEVRVQRLQEITIGDCYAEGCTEGSSDFHCGALPVGWKGPIPEFQALWHSLHGPEAWAENPWVAAITFSVHRGNIDQMPGVRDE